MQTEVLEKKYTKELKIIAEHTAIAEELKRRIDEAKNLEIKEIISKHKFSVDETNELIKFLRKDKEELIRQICSDKDKGDEKEDEIKD